MTRPKVKICGITNLEDARFCAAAGADFLGFIQAAESPRYVDPYLCKDIIEWVFGASPVGVFVNESPENVNDIVDRTGFALVQAHGDEPAEWCATIDAPVIKAIAVRPDDSVDSVRRRMMPYAPYVSGFLLDTYDARQRGGTGRSFDWRLARSLTAEFSIFLAGGLDRSNVIEATEMAQPFGLDLSSRLESSPGRKDFDRIATLFETLDKHFGDRSTPDT